MTTGNKPNATSFPLRLPRSLKAAAKLMADRDGISLNHFISLAVAEKVERVSRERSANTSVKRA
jgi:predicted HicB family RNase H-like nuclease